MASEPNLLLDGEQWHELPLATRLQRIEEWYRQIEKETGVKRLKPTAPRG